MRVSYVLYKYRTNGDRLAYSSFRSSSRIYETWETTYVLMFWMSLV